MMSPRREFVLFIIIGVVIGSSICSQCPLKALNSQGFKYTEGEKCYSFFPTGVANQKTWEDAWHYCQGQQASLINAPDHNTWLWIVEKLNRLNVHFDKNGFWLGAHDRDSQWLWDSPPGQRDEKITWFKWHEGEPDSHWFINQDCVYMRRSYNWEWVDVHCDADHRHYSFGCEWGKIPTTTSSSTTQLPKKTATITTTPTTHVFLNASLAQPVTTLVVKDLVATTIQNTTVPPKYTSATQNTTVPPKPSPPLIIAPRAAGHSSAVKGQGSQSQSGQMNLYVGVGLGVMSLVIVVILIILVRRRYRRKHALIVRSLENPCYVQSHPDDHNYGGCTVPLDAGEESGCNIYSDCDEAGSAERNPSAHTRIQNGACKKVYDVGEEYLTQTPDSRDITSNLYETPYLYDVPRVALKSDNPLYSTAGSLAADACRPANSTSAAGACRPANSTTAAYDEYLKMMKPLKTANPLYDVIPDKAVSRSTERVSRSTDLTENVAPMKTLNPLYDLLPGRAISSYTEVTENPYEECNWTNTGS